MITTLTQKILLLGETYHLPANWLIERPHLFSQAIVHLPSCEANTIQKTVHAIEYILSLPAFQARALSRACSIAQQNPTNPGVLFSYDFHLTPDGPKLIEINSNAGGSFLIALLEEAQGTVGAMQIGGAHFMAMFLSEWQSKYPYKPLKTIAIVDQEPENQYFYPEFLLFQNLLQAHNIDCIITDPSALYIQDNQLWVDNTPIDFVYNRLTDFDLSQPEHAVLRQAYVEEQILLTPHPYAHALYANKRNLTLLSDIDFLMQCGVDEKMAKQLQKVVPATHMVDPQNAEELWNTRKKYFFKPVSSYAGKGVYRGYNITRRVLADILAGDYIAQTLVPPSEMQVEGEKRKVDLRAYVYAGQILSFGARLYQGQTTNLRTPGGGFAVVRQVDAKTF